MVLITLTHTCKTKKTHISPFNNKLESVEYLELSEYLKISKKCINAFAGKQMSYIMLKDEDAISYVAEELILATAKFNGYGNLYGYLASRAKFAVKRWIYLHNKISKNLSLNSIKEDGSVFYSLIVDKKAINPSDFDEESSEKIVNKIINVNGINARQKECLLMYYVDRFNKAKIARSLNITRQAVGQHINNGLRKIRKYEI
jgi:RNA polymerase sigma factor (sigma-70 family)